jgi:AraC-like DNA-binding protein
MIMMKNKTPQYPFERLYVTPFTKKRGFDEQTLSYKFVPMESTWKPTGVEVLDHVVDLLRNGRDPREATARFDLTYERLSEALIALTGMPTVSLRKRWNMQLAGELLRYTDLPLMQVMRRCGYTSRPTFSNFVRQWWGASPLHLRANARKNGDIGKYAL